MTTVGNRIRKCAYHPQAYPFIFSALRHAQQNLGRDHSTEETGHISGPELLEGVRQLALQHFGMLAPVVFRSWGITATDDFGHIVFELIESGQMRKTDEDQLAHFIGVYDFETVFCQQYSLDISELFK
ncbi:MAG: hypothetical protein KDA96_26625 [Planctomycetaceae bacterium]|nr:hypothetical protein [Planctomycetaceae bacterium]